MSLGRLDKRVEGRLPGDAVYQRLTLARRYIADNDPRKGMSAHDMACRVGGGPEEWAINVPWLALPWKVPPEYPAPLPAHEPHVAVLEANCEEDGTDSLEWAVGLGPVLC